MITVEFHGINTETDQWEKESEITWDGKRMKASTDWLRRVISEPIRVYEKEGVWRELHAAEDPELWIRSLWEYYSGGYLFATKAKETPSADQINQTDARSKSLSTK